jgi:hypothetical protein
MDLGCYIKVVLRNHLGIRWVGLMVEALSHPVGGVATTNPHLGYTWGFWTLCSQIEFSLWSDVADLEYDWGLVKPSPHQPNTSFYEYVSPLHTRLI